MTKFFSNVRVALTVSAAALTLGACASGGAASQDAGQRMSARGASIAGQGEAWSAGQGDVVKGRKLLSESEKSFADGERDLRKAQERAAKAEKKMQTAQSDRQAATAMIAGGEAQMLRAESDYTGIRSQPSAVEQR